MNKTIPAPAALLLSFIYRTETGREPPECYRVIIGHREKQLPKPITSMTVDELTTAQKAWGESWGSSAAGAAQFLRATVLNLMAQTGVPGSARFDANLQDRFAFRLLQNRGYTAFVTGHMTRIAFGLALAQEWASFPVLADCQGAHRKLKRGQSYYAGDGMNRALVSPAGVEALLEKVLALAQGGAAAPDAPQDAQERPEAPTPVPTPPSAPGSPAGPKAPATKTEAAKKLSISKRFWTWLMAGGGTTLLPYVDWRVQILIVVVVVAAAIYAIATMPEVRKLIGLPVREA